MVEHTTKGVLYTNEIKLNGEDYKIKQYLPVLKKMWFDINQKEQLEKVTVTVTKNGETINNSELFSIVPIFIKSICENIQTSEQKLELLYYLPKLKQWNTIIIPKNILYEKRNITTLASNGLPINSINADTWIKYFSKLEEINYETIPIIKTTSKLGWHKNNTCFVPYTNEVLLDIDTGMQDAYHSKGTLREWIENIKDFRKNNLFRFILSAAFSGPIINPLDQRIFIVYNYGHSCAGKSAAMFSAMSVWGNPNGLKSTFFGTSVGIERTAEFKNDLVLWLDEKQVNKSQNNLEQIVYMLGNGTGKTRGNKTGGIQPTNTWKAVVLASGEETLSTTSSTTGIQTRCLEIAGSPFDSKEEIAEKAYDIFSKYYGNAGKKFIEIILDTYSKNNFEQLKLKFNEVKSKLKEQTTNDINTYISDVSVVTLADIIVSKEFFAEKTEELSYQMGLDILNRLPKKNDIDIVEKCYEQVHSWLLSNYRYFDVYTHTVDNPNKQFEKEDIQPQSFSNTKSFGLYEDGTYYVLRGVLEEFLTKKHYSYTKMVRDFAKRDYILSKKDNKGNVISPTIQKKFRNTNARVFAFPIELTDFDIQIHSNINEIKKMLQMREEEIK